MRKGYFYFEGEATDNSNLVFEVYTKFISNHTGETENIVAVIRDVTALRGEEMMRRNFLEVLSNKLKTRITETQLLIVLLKENGILEEPGEKHGQVLNAIGNHCKRLSALIGRLLLFTEFSSFPLSSNKNILVLQEYIPQALEQAFKPYEYKKIEKKLIFDLTDYIKVKAKELWEKDGCKQNHDLDYWLQAEKIIRGQMKK